MKDILLLCVLVFIGCSSEPTSQSELNTSNPMEQPEVFTLHFQSEVDGVVYVMEETVHAKGWVLKTTYYANGVEVKIGSADYVICENLKENYLFEEVKL